MQILLRRCLRPCALAACLLLPPGLAAQDSLPAAGDTSAADSVGAPPVLVVAGDTIFRPRVSLGPFTPADRVAAAQRRVREVLETGAATRDTVRVDSNAYGYGIMLGETQLFQMTAGDVGGDSLLGTAARDAGTRLSSALGIETKSRGIISVLIGIGLTLLATVVLGAVFRLIRAGVNRFNGRVMPALRSRVKDLGFRGFTLLKSAQLAGAVGIAVEILSWVLVAIAVYAYLTFVFGLFPATRAWSVALGTYLVSTLARFGRAIIGVIPNLVTVAIIIFITRLLSRLSRGFFDAVQAGTLTISWLHPQVATPTRKLVSFLLWVFALILIYPYLPGSDSAAFKGVSLFLGLLISLGSTGIVGNAIGGLVLMYSRAIQIGDFVQIRETTGTVTEQGMLATKIRTKKNVEVTVPNLVMIGDQIRNHTRYARENGLIIHSVVTIGYDVPWRQVNDLLAEAALKVKGVRADPPPFVLQTGLGDFSVSYEINAFIEEPSDQPRLYSDLHANIQDTFNRAGVEILSPMFLVRRGMPENTVVPVDKWGLKPGGGAVTG